MQIEAIGETVKVRADFSGGAITPLMFRWNGKAYRVDRVNTRWLDRQGRHPVHYFSVDVGGDTYELSFQTGEALWRLERVVLDG